MKNTFLAFLMLAFVHNAFGQVKNQTEQIKSLPVGKYLTYDVSSSGQWYSIKLASELVSVEQEKNFTEHKIINFKIGGGMHDKPRPYLPDNMGFPVTLAKVHYAGNDKLKKKVGYVPDEIIQGRTNRVVVLDGIIFDLSTDFDPQNPETFKPYRLYVHESYGKEKKGNEKSKKKKKKKKSIFGALKNLTKISSFANASTDLKLNKENLTEKVVDYLTKAIAQQKAMYPRWKNKPENKTRLKALQLRDKLMTKAIRNYNAALMDTPEWRRIQENNKFWKKHEAKNYTTIQNDTGRDIYIYEEGSHNGDRLFNDGSRSYKCNNTYYYSFSGNASWREGARISGTNCGATATVK